MKYLLFVLLILFQFKGFSQVIDNTAIYRTMNATRYSRIYYENDYFSAMDEYYTQGINLEFVHPVLQKSPISKLLIRSQNREMKYGIALESLAYTATSTSYDFIQYGDRPFAGTLFLKSFAVMNDPGHRKRVTSSLSLGFIGSAAGNEEMHKAIHSWIGNQSPHGWNNQIHNDLILNYQAEYERGLISRSDYFGMTLKGGARLGTLSDKLYGGATFMAGYFDNPFDHFSLRKHAFQVYMYDEPQINFIGYDATLQGGIFNKTSPYTIAAGDITRGVFQNNFGVVFKVRGFYAEYFQTFLSKEFETGLTHRWGGIRMGFAF